MSFAVENVIQRIRTGSLLLFKMPRQAVFELKILFKTEVSLCAALAVVLSCKAEMAETGTLWELAVFHWSLTFKWSL